MNIDIYIKTIKSQVDLYEKIKDMFGYMLPEHELFKQQEELILLMKSILSNTDESSSDASSNNITEEEKNKRAYIYERIITELSSFLPKAMKILSQAKETHGTDDIEFDFIKTINHTANRIINLISNEKEIKQQ